MRSHQAFCLITLEKQLLMCNNFQMKYKSKIKWNKGTPTVFITFDLGQPRSRQPSFPGRCQKKIHFCGRRPIKAWAYHIPQDVMRSHQAFCLITLEKQLLMCNNFQMKYKSKIKWNKGTPTVFITFDLGQPRSRWPSFPGLCQKKDPFLWSEAYQSLGLSYP